MTTACKHACWAASGPQLYTAGQLINSTIVRLLGFDLRPESPDCQTLDLNVQCSIATDLSCSSVATIINSDL